jgi:hypothetical protein
MIKAIFKEIAEKEQGVFHFQDSDVRIGGGVRSPNVNYLVKFKYKDCEFSILNTTGTSYEANITCKLSSSLQAVAFEITSISHLSNLFLRKKSRFKIKAENENITYFLKQNKALTALSILAHKDNYSPRIVCNKEARSIVTKYHLEFDNWTHVVEPTIALYKSLIDEFEKHIAHVNHSQYRNSITIN